MTTTRSTLTHEASREPIRDHAALATGLESRSGRRWSGRGREPRRLRGRLSGGSPLPVRFSTNQAPRAIPAGDVLGATLIALGIGTAIAALCLRRGNRGLAAAQAIGAAVALVSLIGPLSVHATLGTKAALASMHLIAGIAFVAAMGRARDEGRRGHGIRRSNPVGESTHDEAT